MSRPARFGLFAFDADTGVLTREGAPVRLQPQPARVLAILVAHAGEVVTRDTLRQEVWNDGTFVDFERGLNFCIAQIRSALGDAADSPRFIETLPRRGYRFIAPTSQPPSDAPIASVSAPVRPGGSRSLGLVAFALVAVALVAVVWRTAPIDRRVRIAVVPFDNETGMEDFDRIAGGVADATVARLATPERVGALSVIGNAAALHRPRAFRDLQRIGAELHAEYIVLAQMKRDASGVRLIAHLIRVRDQSHLWATTFDRAAFTLDVQAEIAESIAGAVAKTLSTSFSPRT